MWALRRAANSSGKSIAFHEERGYRMWEVKQQKNFEWAVASVVASPAALGLGTVLLGCVGRGSVKQMTNAIVSF